MDGNSQGGLFAAARTLLARVYALEYSNQGRQMLI
uniref:Uncharacterized protein n=1 Tax=Arundo donax TaxID=35708 RepID=A0A0A9HD44_ARUDO